MQEESILLKSKNLIKLISVLLASIYFISYIIQYSQTHFDFQKTKNNFIDGLYWYGNLTLTATD